MKLSHVFAIAVLLSGARVGFAQGGREALADYAATLDALSKQALFHTQAGSGPASVSASFSAGLAIGGGGDSSAQEQLKSNNPNDPPSALADFVKAAAQLRADAKLYGYNVPLLGVGAEVKPLEKSGNRVKPILTILGFKLEQEDRPDSRARSNAVDGVSSRNRSDAVSGKETLPRSDAYSAPFSEAETNAREFGPMNVFVIDPEMKFLVGPVPVYVCGNAGVGLGVSVTPIPSALGASVEGNIYLHGWVSGGIGGKYGPVTARVGVLAGIRALDTKVGIRLGACSPADALIAELRGSFQTDAEIADTLNAQGVAAPATNGWSNDGLALFPTYAAPAAWTEAQVQGYQNRGAWGGLTVSLDPLAVTLSLIATVRLNLTPWYSFQQCWSLVVATWKAPAMRYEFPLG